MLIYNYIHVARYVHQGNRGMSQHKYTMGHKAIKICGLQSETENLTSPHSSSITTWTFIWPTTANFSLHSKKEFGEREDDERKRPK